MTPNTFCEHFATFAEAPNGVAKLRELILQLAVQAKLVPQDENDEPARLLLERVIATKSKDNGATPTSAKAVADRLTDSVLLEVPSTWTWCRLEDINVRAVFASYLIRVTPSKELHAKYVKLFLESPTYWTQLRAMSAGTGQPNVDGTALKSLLVPLPPLAEQRRIVGKVDQLLGLCDELAASQAARRGARSALVGTTLDRLVSARSSAEFPAHSHRLRDNFDSLFDTPTTIPQLRQAILQLAVQGKLVPQDSNDEPADRETCVEDYLTIQNGYAFKSGWFIPDGVRLVRNVDIGHDELRWDTSRASRKNALKSLPALN